mgnify:CR=1 FL=1
MNVDGFNYLGVIEGAEHVGTLNNAKIYKITNAQLLSFRVSLDPNTRRGFHSRFKYLSL